MKRLRRILKNFLTCTLFLMLHHQHTLTASLKNLYTIFDDNYKHLSPVNGAAMINSGWLENFARWGVPKKNANATQRLVMDEKLGLFTITPDFGPTTYQARPGTFLTPEIIGELILLLEYPLFLNSEPDWTKALNALEFKKGVVTQQSQKKALTILQVTKDNEKEYLHVLTKVEEIIKKIVDNSIKIKGEKDPLKNNIIRNFILLMRDSALECEPIKNASYPPHTTQMILLSFLYRHYKLASADYLAGYLNVLNTFQNNMVNSEEFDGSDFSYKDFATFLSELKNIGDPKEQVQFLIKNYEITVQSFTTSSRFPEAAVQGRYCYLPKKEKIEKLGTIRPIRPDCVETGLLDALVSLILYNPDTKQYDITLLPSEIQNNLSEDFKNFIKIISPQKINSQLVRETWYDMLSGHAGEKEGSKAFKIKNDYLTLEYKTDIYAPYEVKSSLENLIKVANYLYGTSSSTMEEFGKALSTDKRTITFETKQTEKGPVVDMKIEAEDEKPIFATLSPAAGHFSFVLQERDARIVLQDAHFTVPDIIKEQLVQSYTSALQGLLMLLVTHQQIDINDALPMKNLIYWPLLTLTPFTIKTQTIMFKLLGAKKATEFDKSVQKIIEHYWNSSENLRNEVVRYILQFPNFYQYSPALINYLKSNNSLLLLALDSDIAYVPLMFIIEDLAPTKEQINVTNQFNETPLLLAMKDRRYHKIAEQLLEIPETEVNKKDIAGATALSYCINQYPADDVCFALLKREDVDINAKSGNPARSPLQQIALSIINAKDEKKEDQYKQLAESLLNKEVNLLTEDELEEIEVKPNSEEFEKLKKIGLIGDME